MKYRDITIGLPRGIEAVVSVDNDSLLIYPSEAKEKLTDTEIGLLTSFTLLYVISSQKGMVMDTQYLLDRAQTLYFSLLQGEYEALRSIKDMTVEEFNERMKKYNGRG